MLKHIALLALIFGLTSAAIADEKPYKEGPVTEVSFIKVKNGKFLDYMTHLNTLYRKQMDAYKKAGLVLEYHIYQARPSNPQDANIILTVTYPNYAVLDRNADFEAIDTKLAGSLKSMDTAYGERDSIRDVLGSNLVQELILK